MSTELTRRTLLIGALAAAGGGAVWLLRERRSTQLRDAVLALAEEVDLVSVAPALGREYLELHADEADADRLAELLFTGDDGDLESIRNRLAERIGRDWLELETVQVDGWIVARSEGRFLALVHLFSERVSS